MVLVRSPWFPLACGAALLIFWVAVRIFAGGLLASVLLTFALPLLFESGAWFGAAKVGAVYYDLDDRVIHSEAYDPAAALVRYVLICGLLLSILMAAEAEVLPRSFVGWLTLILTGVLWLAFAIRSYARQITRLAQRRDAPLDAGRENPG
jgi:hypothetical protein